MVSFRIIYYKHIMTAPIKKQIQKLSYKELKEIEQEIKGLKTKTLQQEYETSIGPLKSDSDESDIIPIVKPKTTRYSKKETVVLQNKMIDSILKGQNLMTLKLNS